MASPEWNCWTRWPRGMVSTILDCGRRLSVSFGRSQDSLRDCGATSGTEVLKLNPVFRELRTTKMAQLCILFLLLGTSSTFIPFVSAQEGFLSLDCGSSGFPYSDQDTGISWTSDQGYVFTGIQGSVRSSSISRELQTLRYFPSPGTPVRNCFALPVQPGKVYLIRAGFMYGNYDSQVSNPIHFQIALDSTPWQNVSIDATTDQPLYHEAIMGPRNSSVSVCLIRTEESIAPFMNSLELRTLPEQSYLGSPSDANLYLASRFNFGDNRTIRYPQDPFDRVWRPYLQLFAVPPSRTVTYPGGVALQLPINEPPNSVMQTAITGPSLSWSYILPPGPKTAYVSTYFAELDRSSTDGRRMIVSYNGIQDRLFILPNFPQTFEANFTSTTQEINSWTTTVSRDEMSALDAIVNADELYLVQSLLPGTYVDDVTALLSIKLATGLQRWLGDPCSPVPWDELTCTENRVTALNLSGQNLKGLIPSSIGGLRYLRKLNLSNNQLSGALPRWITNLTFLESIDLSNNQFSGTFPSSLLNLGNGFRYSGNPLLQCSPDGITPCPTVAQASQSSQPRGSTRTAKIVGAVLGVAGLVATLAGAIALCIICCRPRMVQHVGVASSRNALGAYGEQVQLRSLNDAVLPTVAPPVLGQPVPVSGGKARQFSIAEIQVATSNFSRKIGVGGFGPVFYGVLDDQREVAVKLLSSTSRQGYKEFLNEIELLSTVYHRNLVSLVGYCQESTQLILLYEYVSGGNLQNRLYGSLSKTYALSWRQRLQIALDAARGLEYLHHYCNPAIIHRDVKSANILLTNSLEAKITDFGFSKLTPEGVDHITTVVRGTKGYVDPEYSHSGMLTDKSDVYSFGVVLLELLTGQPPIDESSNTPVDQKFIVNWVRTAVRTGNLGKVLDRFLPLNYSLDAAWKFVEVAMMCVEGRGVERPSMVQVVRELTETLESELRSMATPSPNGAPNPSLYGGVTFVSPVKPTGR